MRLSSPKDSTVRESALTKFTFDVTKSAIYERLEEGDQGIVSYMISGGSVDVRKNGDAYIIRMELTTLYGQTFNFIYEAPISFEPGSSAFEKLDFDPEMDIDKGQGRYYGNWYYPYADDITMHFYNGNFNENGAQIDGLWLNLDMYMPKSDTPATNRAIADGIYTVDKREQAQKALFAFHIPRRCSYRLMGHTREFRHIRHSHGA